jgi:multiple sugar transport system substrate-binding protein
MERVLDRVVGRRWAVGLIAVATIGIGGCGGSSLVTIDRIGRADAPKTLSLQINASYSSQASTPAAAAGFTKLFVQWAKSHPQWRLNLSIIGDKMTTNEMPLLLERARVGQAPDCANVDSFTIPLFVSLHLLQPVDRYFTPAERADLLPYVRPVITGADGHIYAWWWSTDLRVLFRRTDLIPAPPRTWDQLIADATAAKRKDPKVDGYLFNGGRWEGTTNDNLGYFWAQGGRLLSPSGEPVFAEGANAQDMLNLFRFLRRTVTSGATPSRVITFTSYDEMTSAAQAGTVAMFLGLPSQWFVLRSKLPKAEFKNWAVSELPGRQAGETSSSAGGWSLAAFSHDPQKVAACMDIAKSVYVGQGNVVASEMPTERRLFTALKAFQTPIYRTFFRFLARARPRPGAAIYPSLSNELQIAIGRVLTGSSSPPQALRDAGQRVRQIYQLFTGRGA